MLRLCRFQYPPFPSQKAGNANRGFCAWPPGLGAPDSHGARPAPPGSDLDHVWIHRTAAAVDAGRPVTGCNANHQQNNRTTTARAPQKCLELGQRRACATTETHRDGARTRALPALPLMWLPWRRRACMCWRARSGPARKYPAPVYVHTAGAVPQPSTNLISLEGLRFGYILMGRTVIFFWCALFVECDSCLYNLGSN